MSIFDSLKKFIRRKSKPGSSHEATDEFTQLLPPDGGAHSDLGPSHVIEGSVQENPAAVNPDATQLIQTGELHPVESSSPPLEPSYSQLTSKPAPDEATQAIHSAPPSSEEGGESGVQKESTKTRLTRILGRGGRGGFGGMQGLTSQLSKIDYMSAADAAAQILQGRGYAFYGKLVTILLCTFFLADVVAILSGNHIPEPPTPRSRMAGLHRAKTLDDLNIIVTRNLISHLGKMLGELRAEALIRAEHL